jgi:tRNA-specific adenosine deaminase 2
MLRVLLRAAAAAASSVGPRLAPPPPALGRLALAPAPPPPRVRCRCSSSSGEAGDAARYSEAAAAGYRMTAAASGGASAAAGATAPAAAGAAEAWAPEDEGFMRMALELGREAHRRREVPIGCVIVRDGAVVGRGYNRTNETRSGTAHAEYDAIAEVLGAAGGSLAAAEFHRCTLYVTCEPCIMCAGALSLVGMGRVYFGCYNDKFGGCGSIVDVAGDGCGACAGDGYGDAASGRHPVVPGAGFVTRGGLLGEAAIRLLQDFYILGNPNAPKPHRPLQPYVESRAGGEG